MKTNTIILSLATIVLLLITSCNKYMNKNISLSAKTECISNNWKVGQVFDNGKDITQDYSQYDLDLSKAGNALLAVKYTYQGKYYEYITNSTWSFVSNNEKLSFNFSDGIFHIVKLKKDVLWLKKDGGTVELHYVLR